MQALIIIAIIVSILLVILVFAAIWSRLNESCLEKYDYKPLNGWTVFLTGIGMTGVWSGLWMMLHRGSIFTAKVDARFWESTAGNGLVIALFGSLIAVFTILYVAKRTSLACAILAGLMLGISGSVFFVTLAALVLAAMCAADRPNRRTIVVTRH